MNHTAVLFVVVTVVMLWSPTPANYLSIISASALTSVLVLQLNFSRRKNVLCKRRCSDQ